MSFQLPLFHIDDEEIAAKGFCSYEQESCGYQSTWLVILVLGEVELTHRFTDPDPIIKAPNARRRAARACGEMAKKYRIPIIRPARKR